MFEKAERWWDPIIGFCLFFVVFFSAYSLERTFWTFDLNRITAIAMLGIILGMLIGQSTFRNGPAYFLLFLYCTVLIFWQFVFSLSDQTSWILRLVQFNQRFQHAFAQLVQNIPLDDGILFLTGAVVIYAITSILFGFFQFRYRRAWIPLIIHIIIFTAIQFYLPPSRKNLLFSAIFFFLIILYLGRQYYISKKVFWLNNKIKEDKETSGAIIRSILLIAVILIVVAWGLPSLYRKMKANEDNYQIHSWQRASSSWELLRNFFFPLRQQEGFGEGYFPEVLSLGASRSLRDDEIFVVRAPVILSKPNKYYWKGRIFAVYQNGLWFNENQQSFLTKGKEFNPAPPVLENTLTYSFFYKYPRDVVFTPQFITDLDRDAQVFYYPIEDDFQDITSIVDNRIIRRDEKVTVIGGFFESNSTELQNAGDTYPKWISDLYLNLPDDLPMSIIDFSKEVTKDQHNPFEKALTITNFLRENYRFKDSINVPLNEEPVEWFLFKGREGFCNYFASANALMVRALGIPARIVMGYAQGEQTEVQNEFSVKIKDSHTWVEVYFPNIGWIIFEPTPSQPGIDYYLQDIESELQQMDRREKFFLGVPDKNNDRPLYNEKFWDSGSRQPPYSNDMPADLAWCRKYAPWLVCLIVLTSIVTSFAYFIIFRERTIQFPIIVNKYFTNRQLIIPGWIRNWSAYEQLSLTERKYKQIKNISKIILSREGRFETPYEFLNRLFNKICLKDEDRKLFLEIYQNCVYKNYDNNMEKEMIKIYRRIIWLILLAYKDHLIELIRFRILLIRVC